METLESLFVYLKYFFGGLLLSSSISAPYPELYYVFFAHTVPSVRYAHDASVIYEI